VCLTPDGRHGAASLRHGATYSAMTATGDGIEIHPCATR